MIRSLPNAVRAAIAHGNALIDIRPEAWAATYRCTTEAVKAAWEAEMTKHSTKPQNIYGAGEVDGK